MWLRPKPIVFLAFAVAVVLAVLLLRTEEPKHRGKPLSYWLRQYENNLVDDLDYWVPRSENNLVDPECAARRQEAREAINSLSTNAIPLLIVWAGLPEPAWPNVLNCASARLPLWFHLLKNRLNLYGHDLGYDAGVGFMILGTNARPALPNLVKLMVDKTNPDRAARAALYLSWLGPETLPFLATEMSNSPPSERRWFHWVITNNVLPTLTSRDQLPLLLSALQNPDDPTAASNTIWRIAPGLLTNIPAH